MKAALFAGSFDPPTLGHADIIHRAAELYDKLYVGLAGNTEKTKGLFSLPERRKMLERLARERNNVEVVIISGLVVDFIKDHPVDVLVRSLRNPADMEREFAMAAANKQMAGIETVFLMADPRYAHLSSTLVREIASLGGSLKGFVPDELLGSLP